MRYLLALVFALPLTLATLLIPKDVPVDPPYDDIAFGHPFHFVTADLTLAGPGDLPPSVRTLSVSFRPLEDPHEFDGPRYVASWAVVAALAVVLVWGLPRLVRGWPVTA